VRRNNYENACLSSNIPK